MGATKRREKDREKMRGLILDTAMRLFLSKGYEQVTLRAIAREMDYSPGIIYWYFKDRNDILYSLHAIGFEKLDERQNELRSIHDPWKRLRRRAEIYLSFALKNPEYYDLMFIMRGPAKKMKEKKNWAAGLRSYEMLKKDVVECIKAGYTIKANADAATFAFWSFVHGIASLIIRDRCIMYPVKMINPLVRGAVDFVMKGMLRKDKT